MPAFAFPESVRPVVGSICRNGQVLVISAQYTVHRYTGTPHHVLSCESQHTPQWVGHHPTQKKTPQKNKINSQLFTTFRTFHNFSQFFTIFHQPSQFYSGFRVVKTCENLSHFVKICEMHTPREAPESHISTSRNLLKIFFFTFDKILLSWRLLPCFDSALKTLKNPKKTPFSRISLSGG